MPGLCGWAVLCLCRRGGVHVVRATDVDGRAGGTSVVHGSADSGADGEPDGKPNGCSDAEPNGCSIAESNGCADAESNG